MKYKYAVWIWSDGTFQVDEDFTLNGQYLFRPRLEHEPLNTVLYGTAPYYMYLDDMKVISGKFKPFCGNGETIYLRQVE